MTQRLLGALAALLLLSSCGITYINPQVGLRNTSADVKVVDITTKTVSTANAQSYVPRSLPDVFFAATGGSATSSGPTGLPTPPTLSQNDGRTIDLRLPPPYRPGPYTIGVGDVVLLATRNASTSVEQLSGLLAAQNQRQGYTVRDDGTISIPDVGSVRVGGLTIDGAEAEVFQRLASGGFNPVFSLEIAEFRSQMVAVGGAVKQTALLPITLTNLDLGDAITRAGGITAPDEEFVSIRLYRDRALYQIPYASYLSRPELRNLALRSGDAIYVDTSYDLDRALQFYEQQIDVIQLREQSRATALTQLRAEVELRRAALEEQRSNFKDRTDLDGEARDYVYLAGEVANQARFPLPYGRQANLADALFENGGFESETGNAGEIYVLRANGESTVTAWRLNASNAINLALATTFQLRPNDIIFIESQPITVWNRAIQQAIPSLITISNASN